MISQKRRGGDSHITGFWVGSAFAGAKLAHRAVPRQTTEVRGSPNQNKSALAAVEWLWNAFCTHTPRLPAKPMIYGTDLSNRGSWLEGGFRRNLCFSTYRRVWITQFAQPQPTFGQPHGGSHNRSRECFKATDNCSILCVSASSLPASDLLEVYVHDQHATDSDWSILRGLIALQESSLWDKCP